MEQEQEQVPEQVQEQVPEQVQEQVQEPVTMEDMIIKYNMNVMYYDPLYQFIVNNGGDGSNDFYCYYQSNVLKVHFRSRIGEKVYDKYCSADKIDSAIEFCKEYLEKYNLL